MGIIILLFINKMTNATQLLMIALTVIMLISEVEAGRRYRSYRYTYTRYHGGSGRNASPLEIMIGCSCFCCCIIFFIIGKKMGWIKDASHHSYSGDHHVPLIDEHHVVEEHHVVVVEEHHSDHHSD